MRLGSRAATPAGSRLNPQQQRQEPGGRLSMAEPFTQGVGMPVSAPPAPPTPPPPPPSQQRTVRFAGVVQQNSPLQAVQPSAAQHDPVERRASLYGYTGVSGGLGSSSGFGGGGLSRGGFGSSGLPPGQQQEAEGRRASMYAAIGADVGPPAMWATSTELRAASVGSAVAAASDQAEEEEVDFGHSAAAAGGGDGAGISFASAGSGAGVGSGGNSAAGWGPAAAKLQGLDCAPKVEEESTMELYSQLIRCRCAFWSCAKHKAPFASPLHACYIFQACQDAAVWF